jgi:capsular exopolysaccharide synthesis family protein
MSVNEKTLLPEDQSLEPSYALRPHTSLIESGNGEWTPSVPAGAVETADAPQLSSYLHALRRHWLIAAVLGVVLASLSGFIVWLLMPSRYTADAYLQCNFQERGILDANRRLPSIDEFENFKNTQMQLLQGRMVLTAAWRSTQQIGDEKVTIAKLPELVEENDPVDWLGKKISVSFPGKGEVMKVSTTTKNPVHSAAIVTAVVNSYYTEVVDAERKKCLDRIRELKDIYEEKQGQFRESLSELKKRAEDLGGSDSEILTTKQQNVLSELALVRSQYINSEYKLNDFRSELAARKATLLAMDDQAVSDLEVQTQAGADPVIRELGAALVWEKQQKADAEERMKKGTKSGAAATAYNMASRMQKEFDARMEDLRVQVGARKKAEEEQKVKSLESQIATAEAQQKLAEEDVKRLKNEADKFSNSTIDMTMLRDQNKNMQRVLETIKTELETRTVEAKAPSRIIKFQDSVEPPKNETGFIVRIAMTGMVSCLGFCLPFLGFVIWDLQSNRINGTSDVSSRLGLPVLGSVPKIPARILFHQGPAKKSHQTWQLRLTESVDGISARLLRRAETDQRRVVMVTSAINGEGKTTLTYQLAMSLARAGRRTLLVDFDLRSPTFDQMFGLPRSPGLSEILRGEAELSSCIHATETENLSILTAGDWDRFALSALANSSVASLFKELREDYEFVIVDTSPILPIADARFVSQYVDSVVLCVFRDISQAPRIRAACEILEAFGVRSVEAVVTGVNEHLGGKHLGYYRPTESATS